MNGQIYFFDDNIDNEPPLDDGYENINFIHIPAGNYSEDHLALFHTNFFINAENNMNSNFATLEQIPPFRYDAAGYPQGLNPYPFYKNSGFHIEADDDKEFIFGDYACGDTLALIFDWDQTMTLTNGMILGDGNTLEEQLADLIETGDVPATWTTETLARWYLHDPDDENRIMNLREFFEEVQGMQIPVFILTANSLSTNNPQIMPDILRAALNLEIPPDRLIRAGHPGGITKPEAIRDQISDLVTAHWNAIAPAAEGSPKKKARRGGRKTRRRKRRRRKSRKKRGRRKSRKKRGIRKSRKRR